MRAFDLLKIIERSGGRVSPLQFDMWLHQLHTAGYIKKTRIHEWELTDLARQRLAAKGK